MALNFPDSPGIGSVFTDTTSGFSWEWTGAVWKSFTPAAAQNIKNLDDVSGSFDNSTQTFNLTIGGVTYYPRAANMLQISLGGIIQEPDTDYTVDFANGTITFTTAPNVGLDFFGVVRGTAVAIDYANDGNVQNKQNYTATEGQTAFTFSAGYTSGYLNVYRNGVKLRSTDFTETSSTVFTLNTPAQENDEIEAIGYVVASIVTTQGQFQNINVTGIITSTSVSTGNIVSSGIITAQDFDALSDINFKENVITVNNALLKVEQLRGVKFDWKESGNPSYGVIAQELEQVLPELVHGNDIKTVNYNGIIGVLIEAIKELKSEIKDLNSQ